MKYGLSLSLLIIVILANGCNKKGDHIEPHSGLSEQLLGRWEAIQQTIIQDDGEQIVYTFGEEGDFEVAYTIGLDYSSGFDLQENNVFDLIWYGINKKQLYSWEVIERDVIVNNGAMVYEVLGINDSILEVKIKSYDASKAPVLINGETWYRLQKLE